MISICVINIIQSSHTMATTIYEWIDARSLRIQIQTDITRIQEKEKKAQKECNKHPIAKLFEIDNN